MGADAAAIWGILTNDEDSVLKTCFQFETRAEIEAVFQSVVRVYAAANCSKLEGISIPTNKF